MIAVDCETVAMTPIVAPPLVCMSFSDGRLLHRTEAIDAFREALRGEITNTYICFDMAVMCVAEPRLLPHVFEAVENGRVFSIDLNEALHDIARGCLYKDPDTDEAFEYYSQALLEKRYLGIDRTSEKKDGVRFRYGEMLNTPVAWWPEDFKRYALEDAKHALEIHERQVFHQNKDARPEEMRAAWALYLTSAWGIRTSEPDVSELRAAVTKMHDETVQMFTAHGFYRGPGQVNPKTKTGRPYPKSQWGTKNTDVIKERVTSAYKGSPPLTAGGEVATDRDTLSESGDTVLEEFAERGSNEKLFSQYLDVLQLGVSQPIHAEYKVLVRTGRTSCRNPNLQNLPRDKRIRHSVVPRSGWLFADADYPAMEFVTLAQELLDLFGTSSMAEALNAGLDPHTLFAARLGRKSYEEMAALVAAGDPYACGLRQLAKAWNYGKGGGMGPARMVQTSRAQGIRFCVVSGRATECKAPRVTEFRGREISPTCSECLAVACEVDAEYPKQWPEMSSYFELISRETPGAVRGYLLTRGNCGFTDGANFRFQHRGAVLAKRALWRVQKECWTDRASPLFGSRPVIFAHDQIIAETPDTPRAREAADRLAEVMRSTIQEVCPGVKTKVTAKLTRRWEK